MTETENTQSSYPRRERKTGRLNVRMSVTELNQLNRISYEDDETVAQVIRKAIKTYMMERNKERGE